MLIEKVSVLKGVLLFIIIIIIIIIIIFNKKSYLNESISTSFSSEFPEYTFRICKGKKIGVIKGCFHSRR